MNVGKKGKIKIREHRKFKQENAGKWYPAEVPGCGYAYFMKINLIPDPFVGTNEHVL